MTLRAAVIAEAKLWLGTPYRHQGAARGIGCDCLGLIRGIWRALYGCEPEDVPAYAMDWNAGTAGDPLTMAARRHFNAVETDAMQPGDLVLFRWREGHPACHAAILMPDNRFIHAYERAGVVSSALVPQWRKRIADAFSFPQRG
jgi:NlpC/P60 family putative phage cell wall peptidase